MREIQHRLSIDLHDHVLVSDTCSSTRRVLRHRNNAHPCMQWMFQTGDAARLASFANTALFDLGDVKLNEFTTFRLN